MSNSTGSNSIRINSTSNAIKIVQDASSAIYCFTMLYIPNTVTASDITS